MKTSSLHKNLIMVPRTSFCNSQQHRLHPSSLSQTRCLPCVLWMLGRTSKEGVERAEAAVTVLTQSFVHVSLALALLWDSWQLFPSLCTVSLENLRQCPGQTGCERSAAAPAAQLAEVPHPAAPVSQTFSCNALGVHNPCHAPAAVWVSPRLTPEGARAELPTLSSWKSQLCVESAAPKRPCAWTWQGAIPKPVCLKAGGELWDTCCLSTEKNVSWRGGRGSGRKTHEALQAALLDAALWHMWEMLVVLTLAPGLSQALASSRAQGTFPNPEATAPALSRARWIRSPGKNRCSTWKSPNKELQPPSLGRGRRKEARQGMCFAAGRAAGQRESRMAQAIGRRGKETVGTRPQLSILVVNNVLSHKAGNVPCALPSPFSSQTLKGSIQNLPNYFSGDTLSGPRKQTLRVPSTAKTGPTAQTQIHQKSCKEPAETYCT